MFNFVNVYCPPTELKHVDRDASHYLLSFISAKHLRALAKTNQNFQKLVYKHIFQQNRQSLEDYQYQCQLLKNWGINPQYMLRNLEQWTKALSDYVTRTQTPAPNRYYAYMCLAIMAYHQSNISKAKHYMNLMILEAKTTKKLILAGLYRIAQFINKTDFATHCYQEIVSATNCGYCTEDHFMNASIYEEFEDLNSYANDIIAKTCDQLFPTDKKINLYDIEAVALISPNVSRERAVFYLNRLLAKYPKEITDLRTAVNFKKILIYLIRHLDSNDKKELANIIFRNLKNMITVITNEENINHNIITSLELVPTWFASAVVILDHKQIIALNELCLSLSRYLLDLRARWLYLEFSLILAAQIDPNTAEIIKNHAKQTALSIARFTECDLTNFPSHFVIDFPSWINFMQYLSSSESRPYILLLGKKLLTNNQLNNIITNDAFIEALPMIWAAFDDNQKKSLLIKILHIYIQSDVASKITIISALSKIVHQLNTTDSQNILDILTNSGTNSTLDNEYYEYVCALSNLCANLAKNTSIEYRESYGKAALNQLMRESDLQLRAITTAYLYLNLILSVHPLTISTVVIELAEKAKQLFLKFLHDSQNHRESPRSFAPKFNQALIYLKFIHSLIPSIESHLATKLVFNISNSLMAFFIAHQQKITSCYRSLLNTLSDLLHNPNILLFDAKNFADIDTLVKFVMQRHQLELDIDNFVILSKKEGVNKFVNIKNKASAATPSINPDLMLFRSAPTTVKLSDKKSIELTSTKAETIPNPKTTEAIKCTGDSPRSDEKYKLDNRL